MKANRWGNFHLVLSLAISFVLFYPVNSTPEEIRFVDVDGVDNFRDVGGYDTPEGTIGWGLLFRSADLSGITTEGIEALKALGVVTVADLRPESTEGDILGGLKDEGFEVVRLPMERDDLKDMAEFYRRIIVKGRQSLTGLLTLLSDRDNLPMIIFDHGGIHEVEVAIIFVLGSCGVGEEDLISDYLLSNLRGAGLKEEWGEYIVQYFDDYGGMYDYITNILKISPDVISNFRKNLIER